MPETQTVRFINPQGRVNTCEVTSYGLQQLYKLQSEGYKVLAVIHSGSQECEACSA